LNVWAYPKSTGKFEDTLLCCVKHNPDPIAFKICCHGAEPDLKVDKKLLEFKKVLLHRKQTNTLHLHNKTMLPVAWKLGGLEQLGEDFSFSQTHGIVQPLTDFPLSVHFRSVRGWVGGREGGREGVREGGRERGREEGGGREGGGGGLHG
jgi:hydrocephalus-inducing protein